MDSGCFAATWSASNFKSRGSRRVQDFAVARGAFFDAEAKIGGDEWFDPVEEEVVEFGAGLAADLDGILESGGGDQCGARAFAFEQRVGADSSAVENY